MFLLPHVSLERGIMLLRAAMLAFLTFYVSRGRPQLNIETLKNYKPSKLKEGPNPWLDIIRESLIEEYEPHMIKIVRSLIKAEQEWGPGKDDIFLKIAQVTVEGYQKYDWSFNGLGFEEEWKDRPVHRWMDDVEALKKKM